jgi:AcrR family transcriptional regulator
MGRPRTTPDAAVLEASARVMSRYGPKDFTLAHIAREAGLAPATLIQRFGSKRGLLLALARMAAEGAGACFDAVSARHRSPLRALSASFEEMARLAETPQILANNLAFLQIDLTDPEFRRWMLLNARATSKGIEKLLDEAIRAKELRRCDTAAVARLLQAAAHGSMVAWAVFQEGTAVEWVRRDIELVLAPYRPVRSGAGSRPATRKPGTSYRQVGNLPHKQ